MSKEGYGDNIKFRRGINTPRRTDEQLSFTDYEHLPEYIPHGIYICEVKIPENQIVTKNKEGHWETYAIILKKKYHLIKDFDKWYDAKRFK